MQPTITHFDDGDGEPDHVYVGRDLTFEFDDEPPVVARIYDDDPHVACLVNESHGHSAESRIQSVARWLQSSLAVQTVKVLGPEDAYVALS